MSQIVPIIMILICLGGGIWFYMKRSNGKTIDTKILQEQSAQEFLNEKDIHDRFLYTRDSQVIAYLKINPISIDLFSDMEKE